MKQLRVSLPGIDVKQAKLAELVISEQYPNPKIDTLANPPHVGTIFLDWVTLGITQDDGITRVLHSFPHNYNYIPTVFASCKFTNATITRNGTLPFSLGNLGMITIDADIKNINFKYYSFAPGGPASSVPAFKMQIKFYVMSEHGL